MDLIPPSLCASAGTCASRRTWRKIWDEEAAAPSMIERRDTPAIGSVRRMRKRIEECFGWLKTIALLRKVRHRGTLKVDWIFTFACAAYNLVRMRNLMAAAVPAP